MRVAIIEYIQNQNLTSKQICQYFRYLAKKHNITIKELLKIVFGNSWQNMVFLIPTASLLDFIADVVKKCHIKFILELAAGHGLMASALYADLKDRKRPVKYIAVDNYSYGFKLPLFYPVKKLSNNNALKLYRKKRNKLILLFYPQFKNFQLLLKKLQPYTKHVIYVGWPQDIAVNIKNIVITEYTADLLSVWSFIKMFNKKPQYPNSLKTNTNQIQLLHIFYKSSK